MEEEDVPQSKIFEDGYLYVYNDTVFPSISISQDEQHLKRKSSTYRNVGNHSIDYLRLFFSYNFPQ